MREPLDARAINALPQELKPEADVSTTTTTASGPDLSADCLSVARQLLSLSSVAPEGLVEFSQAELLVRLGWDPVKDDARLTATLHQLRRATIAVEALQANGTTLVVRIGGLVRCMRWTYSHPNGGAKWQLLLDTERLQRVAGR